MSTCWPRVRLGEVLREVLRGEVLRREEHARAGTFDADGVPLLGVSNVGGLHRSKKPRLDDMSRYLRVEHRWFAYNPMRINVGSVGWAEHEDQTGVISPDYVVFSCTDRVEPQLIYLFLRSRPGLQAINAETAGSVRERLYFDSLARIAIPLPPPDEQRRLVARIEELAARIHAARAIRQGAKEEANAILGSARTQLIGDAPAADWVPLGRFVDRIQSGKSPQCEPRPASPSEWGVLKVGAVSSGVFNDDENKALPLGRPVDPDLEILAGNFLMSRANTTDLVGACAVVTRTRPQLLLSDKTFRLQVREQSQVSPRWLDHVMKSPALRGQIVQAASGTSPTMKNISKERVLGLLMPAHTPREQHCVAEQLDALQDEVYALRQVQTETDAELDALLPAILDRAFKGEL